MKQQIYVTRQLPKEVFQGIPESVEITTYPEADHPIPRADLLRSVHGKDAIVSMLTDTIDGEVLDAAGPKLRVIANMAVGYDNVDLIAARDRGVVVTNTPDVLTETTADLAWALLLATARQLPQAERFLRNGQWKTWSPFLLNGLDVYGRNLGILGLGRIGEAVARRAMGFGMKVLYHNRSQRPHLEEKFGYQYRSLPELLAETDFLMVLTPATPETKGIIGESELARMKPTSVIINVGRGSAIDENALYQALKSNRIWAAGLDVYNEEPLSKGHPFFGLPNAVLLPHIGSASIDTRLRMARLAIDNAIACLHGHPPITPV
jgi:glyoxylate reductase